MPERPDFISKYTNLSAPVQGGAIVTVTDEFFAPAKRMLDDSVPRFIPDRYDAHGKWMDGWESRRRRDGGHDACVVRICPGRVHGVEIDTSHFTGNFAPEAAVEACQVESDPDADTAWTELVTRTRLAGDQCHFFEVGDPGTWTHIRLKIFPDGGIARLKIFGEPHHQPGPYSHESLVDLVSEPAGGCALQCNNMHFGHMSNLISPRPVANMGDGWETRRRREPGNDWVILRLGCKGRLVRVEVDTAFFRGNYPARCSLRGIALDDDENPGRGSSGWPVILPEISLGPDQVHLFESQLKDAGEITHVRFDIYPDGGVARLRLWGVPAGGGRQGA
jgi:allantoicase